MRKLWFAAPALLAVAVFLTTASTAQTTLPGRNPPPQTTPPPQVQVPILTPPRITTAPNPGDGTIPVFIQWREGRQISGLPPRPPASGTSVSYPESDHDGDGYDGRGGPDCDDNNANVSPGRTEIADSAGLDEDCNGLTIGTRDQDGDGFVSWRATQLLTSGTTAYAVLRGPDCDDLRRDVNPDASEVLGDLRDNNCDGLVDQFDGQGHNDYCGPAQRVPRAQAAENPCAPARR